MPPFDWSFQSLQTWALPLGFIVAGALLGWLVERIVLRRLERLSRATDVGWDDVLIDSVRHQLLLWFTALGAWGATRIVELPDAVENVLQQGLLLVVIFSVTLVAARAAGTLVTSFAGRARGSFPASTLVTNLTRAAVFVLGALVALQSLGISITPLITGLGIGGLAVALALQPTLANTFAGLQIIASGQVRNGDYIRLETGEEGRVTDVKWRNTTIKALWDDHEVVVPNSRLGDSVVVNYSLPKRPYWVRVPVGVHYDSDLDRVSEVVEEVAREAAEACGCGYLDGDPVVRFQEFGDSSINLSVRILADRYQTQFRIRDDFIKRLHRRFRREGIEIPFPIRTLHVAGPVAVRTDESAGPGAASAPAGEP